jgi:Insertion element 4 transposase N-terminal/Transposase DDE domain
LRCKSALSGAVAVLTRTIRVAAGVFAPGHLGELTSIVPFELVDDVLAQALVGHRIRVRDLPHRVGVYYLLAMCLFPEVGYQQVWAKLVHGLEGLPLASPTTKALRDLRRRVPVAAVRSLFEVLAGPLARPRTTGVSWRGYRTVSFDGCTSGKVADSERNRAWLGKDKGSGYPHLELMTLVETGTRALLGAVFGPTATGETDYARRLLHLLDRSMLVLWDKGFDANAFLAEVAGTGAMLLGRVKANRRLPVIAHLSDGSYHSCIGRVRVRIVEATVKITCVDGTTYTGVYRLATTLLDHHQYPAEALIALYHERWEHESAYYALRHTLLDGRVLRSKDPAGVRQEMWALLTLYQVLRTAMVTAAETRPGIDPDRVSFTIAVQAARDQVTAAANVLTETVDLLGRIGRRLLAHLLDDRRPRVSTRKVKSPLSRYAARKNDSRPTTTQKITDLIVTVQHPPAPDPCRPQESAQDLTHSPVP